MSQAVKVLFRADKRAPHAVTAVFPTLPGTSDPSTFTVFDSLGGHGIGARGWLRTTRPATPREYRDTARQLRKAYGYKLKIGKRFTMQLLPLYLRKEPTTDPETRQLWPKSRKQDVQAYRDKACTQPAIRWPWHSRTKPRKGCKRVTFNCYGWRAVWL